MGSVTGKQTDRSCHVSFVQELANFQPHRAQHSCVVLTIRIHKHLDTPLELACKSDLGYHLKNWLSLLKWLAQTGLLTIPSQSCEQSS